MIKNLKKNKSHIKAPYPHFRYYKKSGHPALIVGEFVNASYKEEYNYRKVMHGEKDGGKLNEKVVPNPNSKDKKPMYIGKRVRHYLINKFADKPYNWKYRKKNK